MSDIEKYTGIFGFGLFDNKYMNLLTLYFLGIAGIIIKMFFSFPGDETGAYGPALTTLWGYGLTFTSLILIFFLVYSFYYYKFKVKKVIKPFDNYILKEFVSTLFNTGPIIFTAFLILYIMYLNYTNLSRLNKKDGIIDDYNLYNNLSSFLIIVQLILIYKYVWNKVINIDKDKDKILVALSYLVGIFNLILIIIIHIILYFYSVDK